MVRAHALIAFALCCALSLIFAAGASAQTSVTNASMGEHGDGYNLTFAYPHIAIPSADASVGWGDDRIQGVAQGDEPGAPLLARMRGDVCDGRSRWSLSPGPWPQIEAAVP